MVVENPDRPGRRPTSQRSSALNVAHFHRSRAEGYRRAVAGLRQLAEIGSSRLLRCNDPAETTRRAALTDTQVPDDGTCLVELQALAELAAATADAFSRGDLEHALDLADRQSALLSAHSLLCLGALVTAVEASSLPPIPSEQLAALDALLRGDERLLVGRTEPGT